MKITRALQNPGRRRRRSPGLLRLLSTHLETGQDTRIGMLPYITSCLITGRRRGVKNCTVIGLCHYMPKLPFNDASLSLPTISSSLVGREDCNPGRIIWDITSCVGTIAGGHMRHAKGCRRDLAL